MKLYTYSTARQRLAEVLEAASREGEVQIRRQDGRVYAVTPVAKPAQSPFASVTGRARERCDVEGSTPNSTRGSMGPRRTRAAQRPE
jgi:antitoxin Phd